MKHLKAIMLFLLVLLIVTSKGQGISQKVAQFEDLKSHRLIVALSNDSLFNQKLDSCFKKAWTFNSFKIVTQDSIPFYYKQGDYILGRFFMIQNFQGSYGNPYSKAYEVIGIAQKGVDILKEVEVKKALVVVFAWNDLISTDVTAELIRKIYWINGYCSRVIDRGRTLEKSRLSYPLIMNDISRLKQKILLVDRSELNPGITYQELISSYKSRIQIATSEEIAEVIRNNDPKYAYVVGSLGGVNNNTFVIQDAETGFPLFYGHKDFKTYYFTLKDFISIIKD